MRTKRLIKQAKFLLKKKSNQITPEGKKEIQERIAELERANSRRAKKQVEKGAEALGKAVARHIPRTRLEAVWEWVYSLGTAVLIALVIRHFAVEPFKIPSGSMIPTLEVGDKILVNKFTYGVRLPFSGTSIWSLLEPDQITRVILIIDVMTRGLQGLLRFLVDNIHGNVISLVEDSHSLNGIDSVVLGFGQVDVSRHW